jgi:hypothetical protein
MTEDERIDLHALDPSGDPARLDRTARAIAARVGPVLAARRAALADPWSVLAAWRRPVLAAAAVIALVSVVTLLRTPVASNSPASVTATAVTSPLLSEAAGLPGAVASYVEADVPPSPSKTLDLQGTP